MVRGFNPARLNKARQAQLRGDTASPTKNGSQQESAQRPGAQLEMFGLCPVTPTQPGAGSSVPSPGPRAPSYTLRLTPTAQLKAMSNRERAAMPLGDAHTLPMAQNGDEHLVNTLSERQVNELRVAFDRFDANGDGTISAPEMRTVCIELGASLSDEEMDQIFAQLDVDASGRLDWSEYLRAMARQLIIREGKAELDLAFDYLFRERRCDDAGTIPAAEIRALMQTGGDPLTDEEADAFLQLADPGGTGLVPLETLMTLPCWEVLDGMQRV